MTITRKLIRTDGTEQIIDGRLSMPAIVKLIGADTIDTVSLRHMGHPLHVMIVDDVGMIDGRAVNVKATELYHANCRPDTPHQIYGDVVIVPDHDFGSM